METITVKAAGRSPARRMEGRPVLLAWELGGGLGHVRRLLALAGGLARHGHRPVFAVKDLVEAGPALPGVPFPVLQAPVWPARSQDGPSFLAASYADILAVRGFAVADDLLAMVNGWQALIDLVRPALVVCDHSPTLCLAAYGSLPTALVGTGFSVPPATGPSFPPLVLNRAPQVPEERLLALVREVQRRRGRPAPDTLPALFRKADRFVTVLPELDPYGPFRAEPHFGPVEGLPTGPLPQPGPGFFAYLSATAPQVEAVLTGLTRAGLPGTVYLRGASPEIRRQVRATGLEVLDAPADMAEVVRRAAVIVHHGGQGLGQFALAAGRPQLLFPTSLEQLLNAQLLEKLGVAKYLVGQTAGENTGPALRHLAGGGPVEQAQARAREIHARGPWDPLPAILDRFLSHLHRGTHLPEIITR